MILRRLLPALFLLLSCAAAQKTQPVDLVRALEIPMRDGVKLKGTVYKPAAQAEPLPVIFTLTPYIGDTYHERAYYFAQHGYVFVLVDVRGRGNSGGTFDPFAQEPHDGSDVVEFLAKQPWCNGKVAMWGGSYAGYDQWATLKERPPHLATVVPVAAAHAGVDFPFFRGIWGPYVIQWLTYTSDHTPNLNLFGQSSFWTEKFTEVYEKQLPFEQLDRVAGNTTTVFQKWLQHPSYDAFWQALAPTPAQYAAMSVPILTITGHYDGDQAGAMSYYREHMAYGNAAAREQHYLIIGPWDHAGTRTPRREVGGLTFGEASMLNMNDLHRQWYDWTMKNGPKPEFLKKHVAYYVVGPGAENWKYADSLEAVASEHRKLYLTSHDSLAGDAFHSGELAPAAAPSSPDAYVYDPRDLRPGRELEQEDVARPLMDERYALNLYGGGVVYHTAPFPEATEISGYVRLALWAAMDVPDTDFNVTLYEIRPDGSSIQLTSDALRARYRKSLSEPELVKPGAIELYDFNGFTWFSRRVAKNSRLRLVITCPNSINSEKNYNSGGRVEAESGKDARVAHITIYHDQQHPSTLEIPVVK
ncbi:MAG: CocE/NonD family hydrolase [Acidobacteria bacterium]|nr:CocE/NonD family hydrolase [Acidobacteriota bacterium]